MREGKWPPQLEPPFPSNLKRGCLGRAQIQSLFDRTFYSNEPNRRVQNAIAMTTGGAAFWIYLGAFVNMGGGAGLVLGVIARFAARPYDTPLPLTAFFGLLLLVASFRIVAPPP